MLVCYQKLYTAAHSTDEIRRHSVEKIQRINQIDCCGCTITCMSASRDLEDTPSPLRYLQEPQILFLLSDENAGESSSMWARIVRPLYQDLRKTK